MSNTIDAIARSLSDDVRAMGAISHNVANLNTPGFRAGRTVASFGPALGAEVALDLGDGPLAPSGRSLDLALRGRGFFQVQRGEQLLLTRAGNFRLDTEGRLVTASGDLVMGEAGPIALADETARVDGEGRVLVGERVLDRLRVVDVAAPERLMAASGGAFTYDGGLADWRGSVVQGAIERSNVDPAEETVRLMELTRHAESVQRAISIYDKTMEAGINRLGEN
ncbi:MAG: flagellar hook basal-body protein [Rhizobium sp.]|nr:flagellar hook basal-body protein [Rhizobium sp.]